MDQVNNVRRIQCEKFFIQALNFIDKKYGIFPIESRIYELGDYKELTIKIPIENEKDYNYAKQIYKYISNTFAVKDRLETEFSQNRKQVVINSRCYFK